MRGKNSKKVLYYSSPIGFIEIISAADAITGIYFCKEKRLPEESTPVLKECRDQLQAYFAGQLQKFDLPLSFSGTEFQQQVWQALQKIPFGETESYSQIAKNIHRPKAVRAVGGANHRNPISIVIPCHRVIGANGKLVGYGGGLWRKQWLLEHEVKHK
ncbi:MAG: methylated-DNA--[protein]-cysteine S-methyltransferase [Calditrichaeota bacterium]|nr:methylated-DNA--[protein]-cysteine S-methyltransferase [Calditrichota bacterium]